MKTFINSLPLEKNQTSIIISYVVFVSTLILFKNMSVSILGMMMYFIIFFAILINRFILVKKSQSAKWISYFFMLFDLLVLLAFLGAYFLNQYNIVFNVIKIISVLGFLGSVHFLLLREIIFKKKNTLEIDLNGIILLISSMSLLLINSIY